MHFEYAYTGGQPAREVSPSSENQPAKAGAPLRPCPSLPFGMEQHERFRFTPSSGAAKSFWRDHVTTAGGYPALRAFRRVGVAPASSRQALDGLRLRPLLPLPETGAYRPRSAATGERSGQPASRCQRVEEHSFKLWFAFLSLSRSQIAFARPTGSHTSCTTHFGWLELHSRLVPTARTAYRSPRLLHRDRAEGETFLDTSRREKPGLSRRKQTTGMPLSRHTKSPSKVELSRPCR
jgi:hypothetical protein